MILPDPDEALTPEPTVTRAPETNYVDQAIDREHDALLAEVNALPTAEPDGTSTSNTPTPVPVGTSGTNNSESHRSVVRGARGAKIKSQDNALTVGMLPGTVPMTATDVHDNIIYYSYRFKEKDGTTSDTPFTGTERTRAVYPRQILYGAGGNKIKVDFNIVDRAIGTIHDIGGKDEENEIYQGKRIDGIKVSRLQQSSGLYQLLRSYNLTQVYTSIVLGNEGNAENGATYRHLALTKITVKGNDNTTYLPSTTFTYYPRTACGCDDWYDVEDWGHLYHAGNGYGGSVWYYYDAAAVDVSQWHRRVRNKRVRDGLLPLAASDQSTEHDMLYTYEHRGAQANTYNISAESGLGKPLHVPDNEFRGFAWVRVTDPSGSSSEHFFSQDDAAKAKEWRTQSGEAYTFQATMTVTLTGNLDWTLTDAGTGSITQIVYPTGSGNYVWKMLPGSTNVSASRYITSTAEKVYDGATVSSRFMIGTLGEDHKLVGTWQIKNDSGTGDDYWGIRIENHTHPTGGKQYHAWLIWKSNGTSGQRLLTDVDNSDTVRPFREGPIALNAWYTVRLHTSPDGRFAMEMHGDNKDHIIVRSGDLASNLGLGSISGASIPTLPTGKTWKFEQITAVASGSTTTTMCSSIPTKRPTPSTLSPIRITLIWHLWVRPRR